MIFLPFFVIKNLKKKNSLKFKYKITTLKKNFKIIQISNEFKEKKLDFLPIKKITIKNNSIINKCTFTMFFPIFPKT